MIIDAENIKKILTQNQHRPFLYPDSKWTYYQEWNDVIFLHIKAEKKLIERFIPRELELDSFDGNHYISIVLFSMEKVRPRNIPALNFISNFHEINIRTYVTQNGKSGVYFLNIEGEKSISCFVAKTLSGLQYKKSMMNRISGIFTSENRLDESTAHVEYKILNPQVDRTAIDNWLTERYCMYNEVNGKLYRYDIHHLIWPLSNIHIHKLSLNYPKFDIDISESDIDMCHYSPGVKVLAWSREWI